MTNSQATSSRLLAYLQLMRLPNVFTAMADVMMGFCFYWVDFNRFGSFYRFAPPILGTFVLLMASSSSLYAAGMVLNDVFDFEQDRLERPSRPLPSGRVSLRAAKRIGCVLSIVGLLFGWWAMVLNARHLGKTTLGEFITGDGRSAVIVTLMLALIILYDRWLKRTPLGPLAVGGCRFLNVLLGMSAWWGLSWTTVNYVLAAGVGVYVVGVTAFARREAVASKRRDLIIAFLIALIGIGLLWWFPMILIQIKKFIGFDFLYWSIVWVAITVLISRRFVIAIIRPESAKVQAAVKSGIMSIVILDAMAVFPVGGYEASFVIALLLVPAIILGRWVYST